MQRPTKRARTWQDAAIACAITVLVASLAAPHAQQPAPATPAAPAAPPAKPYIPLAASTLADHPDPYYGERVTVTAAVEKHLSRFAFSVDQDKTRSTGKEVLVLAPTLQSAVELNTYVTVIGEVVHLDPAEIAQKAKNFKLDLAQDVVEKYRGTPAIVATAVINAAGVDVAKKPIPPPTAEEEALDKIMKQVGPANTALHDALDKMDPTLTKQNVAVLQKAFTETEAFWKAKGKPDATQWAQDARKHIESIDRAFAAAKWDEAKTAAGNLGQMCANCHAAYRERVEDGTYRIKTPGLN